MIVNDIVANLQFPLIKAYQVTEKQSSTQCQWKDKVNKHLWIIQACIWKKIMLNDCFFTSRWTAFWTEGPHIRLDRAAFYFWPYCRCMNIMNRSSNKQTYSNFIGLVQLSSHYKLTGNLIASNL